MRWYGRVDGCLVRYLRGCWGLCLGLLAHTVLDGINGARSTIAILRLEVLRCSVRSDTVFVVNAIVALIGRRCGRLCASFCLHLSPGFLLDVIGLLSDYTVLARSGGDASPRQRDLR